MHPKLQMRLKLGPHNKNLKERASTSTMRKYYQLALAVVCVVSVVTLLFYRHEYYRLRYVLEVLNFFGKPGSDVGLGEPNLCLPSNVSAQGRNKFLYTNPLPVWQRLADSHYVYSAFWEISDKDRRVKALSFGTEEQDVLEYGCHLWFDVSDEPVSGKFSFSKAIKESQSKNSKVISNLESYELLCRPGDKSNVGIPYGVSFFKSGGHHSIVFIPVHYSDPKFSNTTSICIVPAVGHQLQKSTIVEFLSYHQVMGASEFIIYNSGPLSRFVPALTDSSMREKLGLAISILPWNFPFSEAYLELFARGIIEKDCLLRSKGKTRSVAILDWNEYIVPKYHGTLPAMLGDLGKTASLFKVMVAVFCTQLPDNLQSGANSILALRKTHYISEPERNAYIFQPGQANGRTQRILPGIAVVHRYVKCTEQQLSLAQDNTDSTSMLRFAGDLTKSRLLKAWHLGYIFV